MKKILFVIPKNIKVGQPSFERINAFRVFFNDNGYKIIEREQPSNFYEVIQLMSFIVIKRINKLFITMPPFRNWWVFFLPRVKKILDIRDGWSIAISTGYGGKVKPNRVKAFVVRLVEKSSIKRSNLVITCTPGLKFYLEKLSKINILLITNGYSEEDVSIVAKLKAQASNKNNWENNVAVCVGQFSEYGKEKVISILKKVDELSLHKKTTIKLIGSSVIENHWIYEWIKLNSLKNIELEMLPRMSREKMYKEILDSDYGLTVIRNPSYDLGTKVYDYILCNKPIFNYFREENEFTIFFHNYLLEHSNENIFDKNLFNRKAIMNRQKDEILEALE